MPWQETFAPDAQAARYVAAPPAILGFMPEADVWVGLVIQGDFDPNDITRRLGLEPEHAWSKGDVVPQSRRGRTRSTSSWAIYSGSSIEADTIEPHLAWLLDLIEPHAEALSVIVATGAFAYADCLWASPGLGGGPWIEPESMRRLAALDLPLIISFAYATDVGNVRATELSGHVAPNARSGALSHSETLPVTALGRCAVGRRRWRL